jgi:hypothetical protein
MSCRPVALALCTMLFLPGCEPCVFGDCEGPISVAAPAWDTGGDTGSTVSPDTSETGEGSSTGSLEIAYALTTLDSAGITCVGAAVASLEVTLTPTTGDEVVIGSPCTDEPVRLFDLSVGTYELEVRGDTDYEVFYASELIFVQIAEDTTTEVSIDLECDENGLDDGCGGA